MEAQISLNDISEVRDIVSNLENTIKAMDLHIGELIEEIVRKDVRIKELEGDTHGK